MADLDDDATPPISPESRKLFDELNATFGFANDAEFIAAHAKQKANPRPVTMTKEYYLEWIEEELGRAFRLARKASIDQLEDLIRSEARNLAEISGWGGCQS
jgi:hypothetical protein